jgi:glycosyltransferase involved in cell wall biosynthesis
MVHGIHDFRSERARDRSSYARAKKTLADIRWWPYYHMNWSVFRKFDAVLQLDRNDFGYRYFSEHGIESHVLCNAVDERFFNIAKKKRRVINVGTYHRNKNQMACLEAFYLTDLPGWELMLIGSSKNDYYRRLLERQKKLEDECGHRNVQIVVGESRDDTVRHIMESRRYLLTSVTEMQPVSLLEAMATGAAFVSTDVGVNRFLPGGLIREGAREMADAMEYLAENDRWRVYGTLGREHASENCQMDIQVGKLEALLLDAVRQNWSKR